MIVNLILIVLSAGAGVFITLFVMCVASAGHKNTDGTITVSCRWLGLRNIPCTHCGNKFGKAEQGWQLDLPDGDTVFLHTGCLADRVNMGSVEYVQDR